MLMKIDIKYWLKFLGVFLAIFIFLFIAANYDYFWQNFHYSVSPHPVLKPPTPTPASPKVAPNILAIPSLGISVPVVYATGTSEKIFQADLINGVVHYMGTANPGQPGNCYIFGHSSDYIWSKGHYKTVFAVLPQIKLGAEIDVSDSSGNKFAYIVTESHEISATDMSVLNQDDTKKILSLQTSYPV